MLTFTPEVDNALSDFIKLIISEVKKEKGIDITKSVENVAKKHSGGQSIIPLSSTNHSNTDVDSIPDNKSDSTPDNKSDTTFDSVTIVNCGYVYQVKYKDRKTGHQYQKGDTCAKEAVSGSQYCKSHKSSKQALNPIKEVKETKVEEVNGKKQLIPPEKKVSSRFTLQEYYPNPDIELTHLYENVYADKTNTVVMQNPDTNSDNKWVLICKSVFNDQGKRILKRFSEAVISELHKQKVGRNYNYIIEESWYKQTVTDFAAYTAISNRKTNDTSEESVRLAN